MKKNTYKRIITIGTLLVFIGLVVTPAINARVAVSYNNMNQLIETNTRSTNSDEYKLLILTPTKFEKSLQKLVDHKNANDMPTILVTLDEVYDQITEGRDDAEKIKYFIKYAIEEWSIEYVLLVGGMKGQGTFLKYLLYREFPWYLPVRYVFVEDDFEDRYLSDLYFADIYDNEGNFSSWDSDNDGRFGEWFSDEVAEDVDIDLYPDVAVGRIPARYGFEVSMVVKRIINYEENTYGQDWFDNMVVVAGDTYLESSNPNWTGNEGEIYAEEALNMTGFDPVRLYTSDGSFTCPDDVYNAVNQGCGLLYFAGHGNPQLWATHPPNEFAWIYGPSIDNMYKFKNKNKLPVCVVSGCHNSQFDVSLLKYLDETARYHSENAPECWGWWITRAFRGGSVATIGVSALGLTKEDKPSFDGGINWLEVKFFDHFGNNDTTILGDTWSAAIETYLDVYSPIDWNTLGGFNSELKQYHSDSFVDVKVVQSWVLFGDPSLRVGGIQ
jgi:hypothetical protein